MKIQILAEKDARRIAAGEVIERPASALRELLDNAIDAGSTKIAVLLNEGGLQRIEVTDDGTGMDEEDLKLSIQAHATSKIRCFEDLDQSYTLGFRGEALPSLVSCSCLTIISRTEAQEVGCRLHTYLGGVLEMNPCPCVCGTKVYVEQLFYNLPARKRFLKTAGFEQKECLKVFYEKALAHPEIQFQYTADKKLKHLFPQTDVLGRVQQIFGHLFSDAPFVCYHKSDNLQVEGFKFCIVAGTAQDCCHNRRYIHIYINGRRIEEFALVQAVLHAYDAILPGGQFPIAFVFLQIRADLVDFNIHPAKREAKIRNLSAIHKAIVQALHSHLKPSRVRLQELNQNHLPPLTPKPVSNPELMLSFAQRPYQPRPKSPEPPQPIQKNLLLLL